MIELKEFSEDMQQDVIDFFTAVFPEAEKVFEPEGRHRSFADVKNNFIGFWCLFDDNKLIGTSAVKKLSDDECELKGLYLYEKYHGKRLGYHLAKIAVDFAKNSGFREIKLDTMSTYDKAVRLYERLGFVYIDRYNANERADIFMKLVF
ncbi:MULTISPECIES: GNAT family N-acetyltransferase [Ruminococcus]|uniref:Acetyltransferase (GNAT) family protein n=1 Tax=Ruminococcus flavefaciens TaxID=1265 RepID=A0A1M7IIN4_RUMFL|nr:MULTISPECIES: GNAT family N-acetyltransferase [Ruminococcus]MCR4795040.1 GNAT family N-acetyltransferase [Ruminococcus sp.]SHM40634.1 Acetyltransferase (GNAT) family protein [Ruminococcus flavefaciens]